MNIQKSFSLFYDFSHSTTSTNFPSPLPRVSFSRIQHLFFQTSPLSFSLFLVRVIVSSFPRVQCVGFRGLSFSLVTCGRKKDPESEKNALPLISWYFSTSHQMRMQGERGTQWDMEKCGKNGSRKTRIKIHTVPLFRANFESLSQKLETFLSPDSSLLLCYLFLNMIMQAVYYLHSISLPLHFLVTVHTQLFSSSQKHNTSKGWDEGKLQHVCFINKRGIPFKISILSFSSFSLRPRVIKNNRVIVMS